MACRRLQRDYIVTGLNQVVKLFLSLLHLLQFVAWKQHITFLAELNAPPGELSNVRPSSRHIHHRR